MSSPHIHDKEKKLGIYVHIPFCHSTCAYCDFDSTTGAGPEAMTRYLSAMREHIEEYSPQMDGYVIDTVYFGGGTPTVFGSWRLIAALDEIKRCGHVSLDAEITLEANPESIDLVEMRRLRRAGFNRISIGVQSSVDSQLNTLGRLHNYEMSKNAVEIAREAGFDNISVDMMFGLPNQTRDEFAADLLNIIALQPDNISCYMLKLEENTPFAIYKDSPFLPDDDIVSDMYLYAVDTLGKYGYDQYEISNFARRGKISEHNYRYWTGGEYIGIGAAAHSYIGNTRYSVISDVEKYCSLMEKDGSVIDTTDVISDYELLSEYLMLRLRTTEGVSEEEYHAIYNFGMKRILELLKTYEERGWTVHENGRWSFTPEGFLLSNTLISELLDAQQRERAETIRPWQTMPIPNDQTTLFEEERRTIANYI